MTSFYSIADNIGRALLHSVWEGAVLASVFAAAMLLLRKRSAQARYLTGCITLLLMVIAPIATIVMRPLAHPAQNEIVTHLSAQPAPPTSPHAVAVTAMPVAPAPRTTPSILQIAASVWAVGLLMVSLWQVNGWIVVRNLVRRATPADAERVEQLHRLCDRVGIRFPIAMRVCDFLTTPALVGWLRPVILIPPAALCDIPVDYFESLLLHELAHVRRHDYLINLLQTIAETLLFYHPVAWWVSRVIRQEREHCCDDETIRRADSKVYVRALAMMESLRADGIGSLALTSTGGNLLRRIERLTGNARPRGGASTPIIVILLLLIAGIVVSTCYAVKPNPSTTKPASRPSQDAPNQTRSVQPQDLRELGSNEFPIEPHIEPGDRLSIQITDLSGPNTISTRTPVVNEEGEVTLFVLHTPVNVKSMTEAEAERAINKAYKDGGLIENSMVNVNIIEPQGRTFAVVGAVAHSGQFNVPNPRFRLLNAIAMAGGTVGTNVHRVVVLRQTYTVGVTVAIEIPADKLLAGDPSYNMVIQPHDTVVVSTTEK